MKKLFIALAVLALCAGTAFAVTNESTPVYEPPSGSQSGTRTNIYFDDMNSGAPGWWSQDESVQPVRFHPDTYYAFDDGTPPNYSYWCGMMNAGVAGDGYMNSWDERLDMPPVAFGPTAYEILTFSYRYHTEPDFDFVYIQIESLGNYITVNRGGWSGFSNPSPTGTEPEWVTVGPYGIIVSNYDNPLVCRFRFVADGYWSDEDGLFDSEAGACHFDELLVFEFFVGTQYFFDDVEDGVGQCTGSNLSGSPSGDYWHLVDDLCSSGIPPTSWWCGDDADTSLIPPNLRDALYSPPIDISAAIACTFRYNLHMEVPAVTSDNVVHKISVDGGTVWYHLGAWVGDFGGCDGWSVNGVNGEIVEDIVPPPWGDFIYKLQMNTDDGGCGPGTAGGAGINLDGFGVYVTEGSPVEESSWGSIKSLFRN